MEKKDIEFLEKFSHDVYKIETSKDDYFRFVELTLKYVELEEFLNKIAENLLVEEVIKEWKDNNNGFLSNEYVDFVVSVLYEAKNANLNSRNEIADGLDNYLFVTKNICAVVHYLISNYLKKYTFSHILLIALCVDLYSYRKAEEISVDEIQNALVAAFRRNAFYVGNEERSFDNYIGNKTFDFASCITKVSIAALSLILRVKCDEIPYKEIADSLENKINVVKEYVKKLFDDPMSFKGDYLWRVGTDNLILKDKDIEMYLHLSFGDYLIDIADIPDIYDYKFIDFNNDFDGDGVGVTSVVGFCKEHFTKTVQKKEHEEFLSFLDEKRTSLKESYLEIFPGIDEKEIQQFEADRENSDYQAIAGMNYLFGLFTGRDFEKAFRCFESGDTLGNPECAYRLSIMYLKGLFVKFEIDKWLFYLNKACIFGHQEAIEQWNALKNAYVLDFKKGLTIFGNPKSQDTIYDLLNEYTKYVPIESIVLDLKRKGLSLKEKYLKTSKDILANYVKYDTDYSENISNLFIVYEDTRLNLYRALKKVNANSIDAESAYEIGRALGGMKEIPRPTYQNGIHFNWARRANEYGPKTCWYILARDLGKKDLEKEILECYGSGKAKKNAHSDELFSQIINDKKSFELFRAYKPINKVLLLKLVESGFLQANGYLMPILYDEGDLEGARKCANAFLSVATSEEILELINDINKNISPELTNRTNYQKVLMRKSKTLKEISIANKSSGCYVATCIYGSYNCPQVWRLRRYRDSYLRKSILGKTFIRIYYAISPLLVKLFGNKNWFKIPIKKILDKMIIELSRKGYSDEPYVD